MKSESNATVAQFPVPTTDLDIDVSDGSIRGRLYRPVGGTHRAALVWLHGGAFIGGSVDMREADAVARAFARRGLLVLNVDYRKVPLFSRTQTWKGSRAIRYPTPVRDCLAGWKMLLHEAGPLDIPVHRTFVGGASAGGHLASMVALEARAAELQRPAGVLLAYPSLHAELPERGGQERSSLLGRPGQQVQRCFMRRMSRCFVGSTHLDLLPEDFPVSPDLADFPPTCIVASEHDGQGRSAEIFARQLHHQNVPVISRIEPRTIHGYLNFSRRPAFARTIETFVEWMDSLGHDSENLTAEQFR